MSEMTTKTPVASAIPLTQSPVRSVSGAAEAAGCAVLP